MDALLREIEKITKANNTKYDKIKKVIKKDYLRVIGEKKIGKKTDPIKANLKYLKIEAKDFVKKD